MRLPVVIVLGLVITLCGGGWGLADFSDLNSERQLSDPRVRWMQFGPGTAGYNDATWFHPIEPDIIVTTPDMFNSYRSIDGGRSWYTVHDYDGSDNLDERFDRVYDMDFCRIDPSFGMAVNRLGVWITTDMGASWQAHPENATGKWGGRLATVAFDPVNQGTVYVGSGNFWDVKGNAQTHNSPHGTAHPWSQKTGPQNPGKIWRSRDGGATWTLVNSGIPTQAEISALFVDPFAPNTVYAGTSYGFYRSDDQGQSWQSKNQGLDNGIIRALDMFVDKDGEQVILYAIDLVRWNPTPDRGLSVSGGIFISTDRGENWRNISESLRLDTTAINLEPDLFSHRSLVGYFELSGPAEARSRFDRPTSIMPRFNRLVVDPTDANRIYVGHNSRHGLSLPLDGVWMTEDGGQNWWNATRIGSGWGNDASYWLRHTVPKDVDLTTENMKFGHLAYNQLANLEYSRILAIRSLAINSRGEVLIGFAQQLLMSRDHGRSWQQVDQIETEPGSRLWVGTGNSNLPGRFIHQDPRIADTPYFTSGEHGLWRVRPGGDLVFPGAVAVEQVTEFAPSPATIAIHPEDANTLYMLVFRQRHTGKLFRSQDGGYTWTEISRPIIAPAGDVAIHQYSFLIDPVNPDNMYFCVPQDILYDVRGQEVNAEFGVYVSNDGGYTWQVRNQGLPAGTNVHRLALDTKDTAIVYAAVMQSGHTKGGLYRSYDGGLQWVRVPTPAVIDHVNDVHIDKDNRIYIATGRTNGSLDSGGLWRSADDGTTWERVFHLPVVLTATTAAYDSNRIVLAARSGTANDRLNPGVYLSEDRGASWIKINTGLGQPDRVMDVAFHITDPNVLWATLFGSGFYKATLDTDLQAVYENHLRPDAFSLAVPEDSQTGLDPDEAFLSWSATNASSYTVQIALDQAMETVVQQETVKDAQVAIRNLHYGVTYYWRVQANARLPWHSGMVSDYAHHLVPVWNEGEVRRFSTKSAGALPQQPQWQEAGSFLGNCVILTWVPEADASFYRLYRKVVGEQQYTLLNEDLPRGSGPYVDNDVVPETEYLYILVSENDQGQSEPSESLRVYLTELTVAFVETFSDGAFDHTWRRSGAVTFLEQDQRSTINVRALFPRATASFSVAEIISGNYQMEAELRVRNWGDTAFAALRLSTSSSGRSSYQINYWPVTQRWELVKRTSVGVEFSTDAPAAITLDQWFRLRFQQRAGWLELYVDDQLVLAHQDETPLAGDGLDIFLSNVDLDVAFIEFTQ